MSTQELIQQLQSTATRLAPTAWRLENLIKDLPEGRTREVAETAHRGVTKAIETLEEEARQLNRWPKEDA